MGDSREVVRNQPSQAHPVEDVEGGMAATKVRAAQAARLAGVRAMPVKVFRRNVASGIAGVLALVTAGAGSIASSWQTRQAREDLSGEWARATGFPPDLAQKLVRMSPEEREQMWRLLSEAEEADPETIEAVLAMMEHGYTNLDQAQREQRLQFLMSPSGVSLIVEEFRRKVDQLVQDENVQNSLVSYLQQMLQGTYRNEVMDELRRGQTAEKAILLEVGRSKLFRDAITNYFVLQMTLVTGDLTITVQRKEVKASKGPISQVTFSTAGISETP